MSDRIVLFYDHGVLYLSNVKRDIGGNLLSGWVENGCWCMRIVNGKLVGSYGEDSEGETLLEINLEKCREVVVPEYMRGMHYNEVICWAEEQL